MKRAMRIDAVELYLQQQGIDYEVTVHEPRYTAASEAIASGTEPYHAAKAVALRDGDGYRLAVLRASDRLDLHKVRTCLDLDSRLRFATERELSADFPDFEVGAIPPFGTMLGIPEIIDKRVLKGDRVLCSGGDHTHSVVVSPSDMARAADCLIADVRED